MKYRYHFFVKVNGKYREGTYGNATTEELKAYVRAHFPAGDGYKKVDLRTLRIISKIEIEGDE